jgi:K+/H+ antiporter YhaU regulatory subunit KhtT
MDKNKNTSLPVYRKIAIDISQDIVSGKYLEGQKLSGRSVLSSQYGVSPETIRKSVYLLKDVGILDVKSNSGVYIISVQKAAEFLKQFQEIQSVTNAKNELFAWMERQVSETSAAMEKMQFIINATGRLNKSTPYTPYEIVVPPTSAVAGKSISELNFWHMTGATIVAIERGEQTILSPGPYSSLLIGDILYIVGDEQALNAAIHFVTDGGNNLNQQPELI